MRCPMYVVDAFTSKPFCGNPAGVCWLDEAADPAWMQSVAAEMKHAETAFTYRLDSGAYSLRWFTPGDEVDLCGHATLATARVLYESGRHPKDQPIRFETKSGELACSFASNGRISMDFPAERAEVQPMPEFMSAAFPEAPVWWGANRMDCLAVFAEEQTVRGFRPDFAKIGLLDARGLILSAPGSEGTDFVSRFFAPSVGVPEDPVTGSAHCALGPYWAEVLGKAALLGRQLSQRGGEIHVEVMEQRVALSGDSVIVLEGEWMG